MSAMQLALDAVIVGFIATATLDFWQLTMNATLEVPRTNWALVGRWFARISGGKIVHSSIQNADPALHEGAIGWTAHYAIGVVYAVIYLTVLQAHGMSPDFASAALFGTATVLAPWFILQPGMGLGVLATKAPKPGRARTMALLNHVVFGVGLFLGTITVGLG